MERDFTHQVFGLGENGGVVWAGPKRINRSVITQRIAKRIQRRWMSWRAQYLRDNPGDYPLRRCAAVVTLHITRIGQNAEVRIAV